MLPKPSDRSPCGETAAPPTIAQRLCAVPIGAEGPGRFRVAMADPCDIMAWTRSSRWCASGRPYIATERRPFGRRSRGTTAAPTNSARWLRRRCRPPKSSRSKSPAMKPRAPGWPTGLRDAGDRSAGPRLVDAAPFAGIAVRGEPTIHIAPGKDRVRIRFRVDGMRQERCELPVEAAVAPRLAHQDHVLHGHAERRVPQGRPAALILAQGEVRLPRLDLPASMARTWSCSVLDRSPRASACRRSGWTWRCWTCCWS